MDRSIGPRRARLGTLGSRARRTVTRMGTRTGFIGLDTRGRRAQRTANALGTGKPEVYDITTADKHGLIIGTTYIRNPIRLLSIDIQGTEGTSDNSRGLVNGVAYSDCLFHQRLTTLSRCSEFFSVKAVAGRKVAGDAVTGDHHGNSGANSVQAISGHASVPVSEVHISPSR
jgi:hypothetical protein